MIENILKQPKGFSLRRNDCPGQFEVAAAGRLVGVEFDAREWQLAFALEETLVENVMSDALSIQVFLLEEFPVPNILRIWQIYENRDSL